MVGFLRPRRVASCRPFGIVANCQEAPCHPDGAETRVDGRVANNARAHCCTPPSRTLEARARDSGTENGDWSEDGIHSDGSGSSGQRVRRRRRARAEEEYRVEFVRRGKSSHINPTMMISPSQLAQAVIGGAVFLLSSASVYNVYETQIQIRKGKGPASIGLRPCAWGSRGDALDDLQSMSKRQLVETFMLCAEPSPSDLDGCVYDGFLLENGPVLVCVLRLCKQVAAVAT